MSITGQVMNINTIRETVRDNAERVAKLGQWREDTDIHRSLTNRVPTVTQASEGFDAGIACALGLIPSEYQELSAKLHANYSKEAVQQVIDETQEGKVFSRDLDSTWWLAASSLCGEECQSHDEFMKSIDRMNFLRRPENESHLLKAASREWRHMTSSYQLVNGIPFGTKDGCIQGAYLNGYNFGVLYSEKHAMFMIGTYESSLGLEEFIWLDPDRPEDKYQGKSGLIYPALAKCASLSEVAAAVDIAQLHLMGIATK